MTISKRLRYEILNRDDFTCRYCGRSAPTVELTVDHVLPTALGGSDTPQNLVAACQECNAGKTSTAPGATLVADVEERALEWQRAIAVATQQRARNRQWVAQAVARFDQAWHEWDYAGQSIPRDADWEVTLEKWVTRGLAIDELVARIPLAMRPRAGGRWLKTQNVWSYFCGIGWNLLTELEDQARVIVQEAKPPPAPKRKAPEPLPVADNAQRMRDLRRSLERRRHPHHRPGHPHALTLHRVCHIELERG